MGPILRGTKPEVNGKRSSLTETGPRLLSNEKKQKAGQRKNHKTTKAVVEKKVKRWDQREGLKAGKRGRRSKNQYETQYQGTGGSKKSGARVEREKELPKHRKEMRGTGQTAAGGMNSSYQKISTKKQKMRMIIVSLGQQQMKARLNQGGGEEERAPKIKKKEDMSHSGGM